jgi:hypothetical protein
MTEQDETPGFTWVLGQGRCWMTDGVLRDPDTA